MKESVVMTRRMLLNSYTCGKATICIKSVVGSSNVSRTMIFTLKTGILVEERRIKIEGYRIGGII